ncbi:NAD(P)-binding protein [Fistulina hepatica ATCC 64428]|uniref:NAD(P)-binding protein n=1 Tax=Fistulina hepatica ATCC 64428 TaxID=1128425 RepID=A0A0D7AA48_9AGAR|nr:NAD(P)-binding protein [Fistulina hepatica ATCC 64428]
MVLSSIYNVGRVIVQLFPPPPTWSAKDIPDLTGKVMIVTGGNRGIGRASTKAKHNATVYVAARNPEACQRAIEELFSETGKRAKFLKVDLADLKSVKAAAAEFQEKESTLHALFNNAGLMFADKTLLTKDGYDLHFGTNVLGHFYFTKLLLPTLISTARKSPDQHVRVVNTSSSGHMLAPDPLDFRCFADTPERAKLGAGTLYYQSKLGNVLFANELARRYGDQGIIVTSLHPGSIHETTSDSKLSVAYPPSYGALTQLYAGTAPQGLGLNGKYLIPWARVSFPRKDGEDPVLGKKLWDWMDQQVSKL